MELFGGKVMENFYMLIDRETDYLNPTAKMVGDFCLGVPCQLYQERGTNTLKITTEDGYQLSLNNTGIKFHDHPVYTYGVAEIKIGHDVLEFVRVKYFTKEKPGTQKKSTNTYGGYSGTYGSCYSSNYNSGYGNRR